MSTKNGPSKPGHAGTTLDRADVERLLADIGGLQRRIVRLRADAADEKATIDARLAAAVRPLEEMIEAHHDAVEAWAAAHRATICEPGTKTARLETGEISWRMTPKSVVLKGVAAVIAELKRRRLGRFIRVKEEVSKEAILADFGAVARIKGITLAQHEELVVKPYQPEIEPVELVRRVRA